MNYLHKSSIIHRDVKPTNIIMNTNMDVKIIDFGLAIALSQTTLD